MDDAKMQTDFLFEDCLIGSATGVPKRNAWAAAGSIVLQLSVLAAIVIVPLFQTHTLPRTEVLTSLYLPSAPPAALSIPRNVPPAHSSKEFVVTNPERIRMPMRQEEPQVPASLVTGVVGGVPDGLAGGMPVGLLRAVSSVSMPAEPVVTAPTKIRLAPRLAEGNLIHDVAPQYPSEAGRNRIKGRVVLLAIIGKDGTVQDLRVKTGQPLLAQAAIDAVKQWRYRPYLLNGEPVEIDTEITINFTMTGA